MYKIQIAKIATIGLIVAAAMGLFTAHHSVKAQTQTQSAQLPTMRVGTFPAAPTGSAHFLDSTLFHYGNDNSIVVGSGYQPIDDAITINCMAPNGCTIGIEQHVQMSGNGTANNGWGICTFVDGAYIDTPGCPFQSQLPTDGTYTVGTFAQQTGVKFGPHSVQTFVYTSNGAYKDTYNIIYRLYHP